MARYHMIVNSGTIPVYRRSDCSGPCGELYPGEVFVNLGVTTGYLNVNEVRFIDPDGRYTRLIQHHMTAATGTLHIPVLYKI
ncbi:hypothetical protein DW994_13990 [Mediterraneibacter gnavus]|nr:hypothetical protein DW994_13990 [Mediterraneibacter gnavus]